MPQLTGKDASTRCGSTQDDSVRPSSNFIPDDSGRATTGVDGRARRRGEVMVTKEPAPDHTTPTPPILLSATVG